MLWYLIARLKNPVKMRTQLNFDKERNQKQSAFAVLSTLGLVVKSYGLKALDVSMSYFAYCICSPPLDGWSTKFR